MLKQEGSAIASIMYTGLFHNDKPGFEYIKIYTDLVKEQKDIPTTSDPQKEMTIDNTTPVPVVDEQGNPVMVDNFVIVGYEQKAIVSADEQGNDTSIAVDDYSKPIVANQPIQKTIGEYDKVIWEHFDKRNPAPKNIAVAIQEGILRKALGQPIPFVFVETPAYLNTL